MKSVTTRSFRAAYRALPQPVRDQARRAFRLFLQNSLHPGLHFKCVDDRELIYSARVGIAYRALGRRDGDTVIWFWIGPHSTYDHRT